MEVERRKEWVGMMVILMHGCSVLAKSYAGFDMVVLFWSLVEHNSSTIWDRNAGGQLVGLVQFIGRTIFFINKFSNKTRLRYFHGLWIILLSSLRGIMAWTRAPPRQAGLFGQLKFVLTTIHFETDLLKS